METEAHTRAADASDPDGATPPPAQPTTRTFRIYRYDPDNGAVPAMQTMTVELDGSDRMLLRRDPANIFEGVNVGLRVAGSESLVAGQQLEDAAPDRIAENIEGVHHVPVGDASPV